MRSSFFLVCVIAAGFVACGGAVATGSSSGGSGSGSSAASTSGSSGASSSEASVSLVGSVNGATFTPLSAIAVLGAGDSSMSCNGQTCTTTSSGQAVFLIFTNRADATCAAAMEQTGMGHIFDYASFETLEIAVANTTGMLALSTYPLVEPNQVTTGFQAFFNSTTATCGVEQEPAATSGSVTLAALSDSEVEGSYEVTFGASGSFSGSFDVPICALSATGSSDGGAATCMQ
jgi:hypothetical protein